MFLEMHVEMQQGQKRCRRTLAFHGEDGRRNCAGVTERRICKECIRWEIRNNTVSAKAQQVGSELQEKRISGLSRMK